MVPNDISIQTSIKIDGKLLFFNWKMVYAWTKCTQIVCVGPVLCHTDQDDEWTPLSLFGLWHNKVHSQIILRGLYVYINGLFILFSSIVHLSFNFD